MEDVNLKTLEISFDRTCNFACSYCNPAFSTTWVKDIKDNGAYTGLVSDGRNHFTHTHDSAQKYMPKDVNPYVEAFWKWWKSDLHYSLQELRITGGEPTMSKDFWDLLEWYKSETNNNKHIDDYRQTPFPSLAFNTNLGCSDEQFENLMEYSFYISENGENLLDMYTSCEATFAQAEYIRDGLDYGLWIDRIDEVVTNGLFKGVHCMATINALSLFSLTDFLDTLLMFKKKMKDKNAINFTLNILRFPSFQSVLVLPDEILFQRKQDLQMWFHANAGNELLHEHELRHVYRLIEYLDESITDKEKLQKDFKNFYTQYDKRRGKSFKDTFPEELVEWYATIG